MCDFICCKIRQTEDFFCHRHCCTLNERFNESGDGKIMYFFFFWWEITFTVDSISQLPQLVSKKMLYVQAAYRKEFNLSSAQLMFFFFFLFSSSKSTTISKVSVDVKLFILSFKFFHIQYMSPVEVVWRVARIDVFLVFSILFLLLISRVSPTNGFVLYRCN